jgi:hypothetical protein
MDQAPLPLDTALEIAQEQNIILRCTPRSIAVWSSNKRVPGVVRRTLKEHSQEIRSMISEHRVETCPSPQLHMRAWYYAGQAYRCGLCEQLGIV